MINLVDDIKADIIGIVNQAVNSARERGQLEIDQVPDIQVEVPRERNHGDFSVNTAMTMVRLVSCSVP